MNRKALYFDGSSPVEQQVELTWENHVWIVKDPARTWRREELGLEMLAGDLHVTFASSEELLIIKNLTWDEAKRLGLHQRMTSSSRKMSLAIILALVTTGAFLGIYAAIRPVSYSIARAIPSEHERDLFDHITPIAFLNNSRCTDSNAQEIIQSLGNTLTEPGETPPTFEILDWRMANAFAFPGRRIYVTQGLLDKLESSEQLLAVLAHEQGHSDLRHNLGEAIQGLFKAYFWSIAVGDFSGALLVDPQLAKDLSDAEYSRSLEADADSYGGRKLYARGHDPKALADALLLISESKKDAEQDSSGDTRTSLRKLFKRMTKIFATHPETEVRVSTLKTQYPNVVSREALDQEQWRRLKNACQTE